VCPVIRLAGHTWDSYLATLGSEHRYNFRRRLRQLTKRFDVRFEPVRQEEQRRTALERLVALHNLRWQTHGWSNAFCSPALLSFHEEISRLALRNGWLRLFTLWLDNEPAASLYGFLYKGVFYFYQSGFDPRYASHSVGLITMGLAIQNAIEEGAEEYDLLHGAEPYKFHWAHEARELVRLELYPSGARGTVCQALRGVAGDLRRVARHVLPPLVAEKLAAARAEGWRAVYAARTR
jgi:CelD/BcsL family acetyltransferase involved in cellulose biosynthesis